MDQKKLAKYQRLNTERMKLINQKFDADQKPLTARERDRLNLLHKQIERLAGDVTPHILRERMASHK